jgi:hypothetical protein
MVDDVPTLDDLLRLYQKNLGLSQVDSPDKCVFPSFASIHILTKRKIQRDFSGRQYTRTVIVNLLAS